MMIALLAACDDAPPPALCITGPVSQHSSPRLAAALHPPRERIVALDVSVEISGSGVSVETSEDCMVERCVDVDVTDYSRSSPENLVVRFIQPGSAGALLMASGLYLSQYREYTDSTHFIDLTRLTNGFPDKIDRSRCVNLTSASQ